MLLKITLCFLVLAVISHVNAGSTPLGGVCTRTLAGNTECAGDNTCTTRVCGASRCWPKDTKRPMTGSRFCGACRGFPRHCKLFWDMGVPRTLNNLPIGYICTDVVNNTQCGSYGGKQLKCTSHLCGPPRCWPEDEPRPDVGSEFCIYCWLGEMDCPAAYSMYSKKV